jgi:hypothetical protein
LKANVTLSTISSYFYGLERAILTTTLYIGSATAISLATLIMHSFLKDDGSAVYNHGRNASQQEQKLLHKISAAN